MGNKYPFLFKGPFAKTSRMSFEVDHPPKRKKPWRHSTFLGMEMSHFNNSVPWGARRNSASLMEGNRCAGRVLRPLSQVEWTSGEGGLPKDGDTKNFGTSVSGAVGNVTYSMDPFWSDVNEDGDKATIDPNTGVISLEENVCQGSWPPWIIYWVCDACGCSSGTIWLEDSSEDCCGGCDCEDTEADCYEACCEYTEDGTPEEMGLNDTKQFTCSGGGEWSVSGSGGTIDQAGLLSTDGAACGTLVVTNSICGDKEIRVQGNGGDWVIKSDTAYGGNTVNNARCTDAGEQSGFCTIISGGTNTTYNWESQCACDGSSNPDRPGLPECATSTVSCSGIPCNLDPLPDIGNCTRFDYVTNELIKEWECP